MYKKVFRALKHDIQKQEKMDDMSNQLGKKPYAFHQPHIILSAENPYHPTEASMTHEQVKEMLENKGYDVEEMKGKYGGLERSLIIKNPPKHSFKHFYELARKLGQDSLIFSNGHEHELHYVNGPKSGKHQKGQGTAIHNQEPDDFYSTLDDGTHFTHNFSDDLHTNSRFVNNIRRMNKSESSSDLYMCKNESENNHPLDNPTPDLKLIHYSPQQGLKTIEPKYHGVRKIGEEAKQGAPEHRLSFFYLEGAKPESIVTTGSKSKYVTNLGGLKIYDIAKDKDKLWSKAKELADQRAVNRGVVQKDDFHQAIKDAGYHGIYNSGLSKDTMGKVVGLFHPVGIDKEYPLHPKDFDEASSKDFHAEQASLNQAKKHADLYGHHNPEFLHNLKESIRNK